MNKHLFKVLLGFALLWTAIGQANAATVDTVLTISPSMHKNIKAVVIKPDDYESSKRFPVIYLLHGANGSYKDWVNNVPTIKELADQYQVLLVCPDGGPYSWYFDSPVNPAFKYETYIGTELVNWVDNHYKTIAERKFRAIAGLSMGGHGAFYIAFKHQDIFGAAGSMSGGLDIRPFPLDWLIRNVLGTYASHPENWEKNTVINMVNLLTPGSLELIMDCGTEDFFYNANLRMHQFLLERKIPHVYIARPGDHGWQYWTMSVQYEMLFFHNYFVDNAKE